LEAPDQNNSMVTLRAWVTDDAAKALFKRAGLDYAALRIAANKRGFRPMPMGRLTVSATMHSTVTHTMTRNVIGIVQGSKHPNDFVVYTAHWDHLGIGTPVNGDRIYNGAQDNAVGCAGLLEIARAFTKLPTPPKRSVLFLSVTAEEQGLLGSEYYSVTPIYPLAKTLANINIDGLNVHGRTKDLILVGLGASDLDDYARAVAAEQGRLVKADAEPEKGFYYRSDHFNFAKQGVPALDPDEGIDYVGKPADYGPKMRDDYTQHRYHSPSDVVLPDWDLSGAREDLKVFFAVGYRVAQASRYPDWKPGNEFRAKREAMLKNN
jgi:Zn-dependent M28 family amino/carboxypeptidase